MEDVKFTPIGATIRVQDPKLKFLLRFDQNVEYKRPAGRILWWGSDFTRRWGGQKR